MHEWEFMDALKECQCTLGNQSQQEMEKSKETWEAEQTKRLSPGQEEYALERSRCQKPDGCTESSYNQCPPLCKNWTRYRIQHHPDEFIL